MITFRSLKAAVLLSLRHVQRPQQHTETDTFKGVQLPRATIAHAGTKYTILYCADAVLLCQKKTLNKKNNAQSSVVYMR